MIPQIAKCISELFKFSRRSLLKSKFFLQVLITLLSTFSMISAVVQAQPRKDDPSEGCAMCGIFTGAMILLPVIFIAINIAILVWVARDAKSRGMDSAVLWMFLVFFTGPIGLLIYVFSRPQGNLIQCSHCKNNRLQASAKCPHCNNT